MPVQCQERITAEILRVLKRRREPMTVYEITAELPREGGVQDPTIRKYMYELVEKKAVRCCTLDRQTKLFNGHVIHTRPIGYYLPTRRKGA